MKRVELFGATSCYFLLAETIRHHLRESQAQDPRTCELFDQTLYVDDFLAGGDDVHEVRTTHDTAIELLRTAGMKLCKWKTNEPSLPYKLSGAKNSRTALTEQM